MFKAFLKLFGIHIKTNFFCVTNYTMVDVYLDHNLGNSIISFNAYGLLEFNKNGSVILEISKKTAYFNHNFIRIFEDKFNLPKTECYEYVKKYLLNRFGISVIEVLSSDDISKLLITVESVRRKLHSIKIVKL